jgi:two-component system, response regulator PdtaR
MKLAGAMGRWTKMALGSSDPAPVVLVAEDEELVRLYAADLLTEAGYKVIDVASAEAALEAMAEQPNIRVLFTDIQMPGMLDGIQLARRVHEQWPDVLLLITSGGRQPAKAEIADHGHFIAKPYLPSDVLNEIVAMDSEADARKGR